MATINVTPENTKVTYEGGPSVPIKPLAELRRAVMTCLLWEDSFYEKGSTQADRIAALVPQCPADEVAALAVVAREKMYLRHVPLLLVRELARVKGNGPLVAETLAKVVQRPDELTEYLAIYWKGKASGTAKRPEPLSAGSKRGLARAFRKFGAHALAKYDRDGAVKLRDVLRLVHAKPGTEDQGALWKHVIARDLEAPDTWEVALSGGADKKATWERLLTEKKLGALAFLRNLRNMLKENVDPALIRARFTQPLDKVLPFRYLAAVNHAPAFASELDAAMLRAVVDEPKLAGRTAVIVDVSGSMDYPLSAKSEMQRLDAASGLAVLVRELSDDARIFSFSDRVVEIPTFRGLALATAISKSQPHGGTWLAKAVEQVLAKAQFDRVIVITDEQSHDGPAKNVSGVKGYIVNVAGYEHQVAVHGSWQRINGWSDRIVEYIRAVESDE